MLNCKPIVSLFGPKKRLVEQILKINLGDEGYVLRNVLIAKRWENEKVDK